MAGIVLVNASPIKAENEPDYNTTSIFYDWLTDAITMHGSNGYHVGSFKRTKKFDKWSIVVIRVIVLRLNIKNMLSWFGLPQGEREGPGGSRCVMSRLSVGDDAGIVAPDWPRQTDEDLVQLRL